MFVFSKGKPKTTNLIADRKNSSVGRVISGTARKPDGTLMDSRSGNGNIMPEYGVRWNYWLIYNQKRGIGHPAPFPFELARDHILSWSNEGDTVLDCFMGSRNDWTCRS